MDRKVRLAVAAGLPALLYVLYVHHYSIDVPNADDWNVIELASRAIHDRVTFEELWSQYGATRLFLVRVCFAGFGVFDDLNQKHIILFSAGTLIASFLLLLPLFRAYLGRSLTFLSVLSLGVVWLSIGDVQNALWGFQLAWYLVAFFFVATAFFLLLRHRHPNLGFALGLAAALLASLTSVQGFVVWGVGLVCLLWTSPWGRRTYYESAIWVSVAVVTVAIDLRQFDFDMARQVCVVEGGHAERCSFTYGLLHPLELAKFLAVLAGNVVPTLPGTYVGAHELLGLAIWIAAGFVVVQSFRERRVNPSPLPVLLIAFALQFDLMLALSRLGQGAAGAGKNWYTMPNIVLLSGIVIFAWGRAPTSRETSQRLDASHRRRMLGSVALAALAALVAIQFVVATQFGIANGRVHKERNVAAARVVVNLLAVPDDLQRICYLDAVGASPYPGLLLPLITLARTEGLSVFRSGASERYRSAGLPRIPHCERQ